MGKRRRVGSIRLLNDCDRALSVSPNLERYLTLLAQRRCDQDVPLCKGIVRTR